MPAELAIQWMAKNHVAGGALPSGTLVSVRSRHLLNPPLQYRIYRLIPKPWWKFWGCTAVEETVLDALKAEPGDKDPGGLYHSAPEWSLPVPPAQTGHADFQAWTGRGEDEAYSGILRSAYLWITAEDRTTVLGGEVAATVPAAAAAGTIVKPKIDAKRTKGTKWVVRAPLDPEVRVRVLQGSDVFEYLRAAEFELAGNVNIPPEAMDHVAADTTTYSVDQPFEDDPFDTYVGPTHPVEVEVRLPEVVDLRAAIALEVLNHEDGSLTRTPPIFATHVGDRVVLTDLTFDMLRDEPRQILTEFAESNMDLRSLAHARREDTAKVWQALVAATQELGAGSVGDAAAFAAMGKEMKEKIPTPVGAH